MGRFSPSFSQINKVLPLLVAVVSLFFSSLALHRQSVESEMQLWNSFRHEFDHEMIKNRKACGEAYAKGKLGDQYPNVMEFFDTLGFLVQTHRISDDLFDDTWGYQFWGYFLASKPFLEQEQKQDPRSYDHVFYLAKHFPKDPTLNTPEDLKGFFEDEKNLPE